MPDEHEIDIGRGSYTPSISADGRFVTFTSNAIHNSLPQIYLRDRLTAKTSVISVDASGKKSHAYCSMFAINANARYIAFQCDNGGGIIDGVNGYSHIYLRDRTSATTSLVSANAAGKQGNDDSDWPSVSANGRFVTFQSVAKNLARETRT
ncbi:MAG: TolB family protein [Gammaproteobacteria bacterium]